MKRLQQFLAVVCAAAVSMPAFAQDSIDTRGDTRFIGKWQGRTIAPINLSNSGRLESLVRAGKIYLSLQDAIALALENNIDIEIQRYSPRLAEADLLRARSGGALRGVSTNVSSGSSGATGQGQSNSAAAGSNMGANALQGSGSILGGPTTSSLDPILSGGVQFGHATSPQTSSFITGTNSLVQTSRIFNFGVSQAWLSGTAARLGFNNSILSQNSYRADFNPVTQANAELLVTQRLLQGFGFAVNNRFIRIAKNDVRIADLTLRQQVINTTANVVSLYYDLVAFNQDVQSKQQALALARKLYNDNQKQVEIGTLAPIEIVRAEAEVASREQDLTTSETNVLQQETILKNALSRTGTASPLIADVRIVPTDRIDIAKTDPVQPVQDMVEQALANRPEIAQSQIQLDNSRIALQGTKNALLPSLDGFVDVVNRGLAGSLNTIPVPGTDGTTTFVRAPGSVDGFFLGGYGTAMGQLFRRNFPDYAVGVQLSIPLRNRSAQADYATAQFTLRQNELQVQRQVNGVRVDVQNAIIALQQARARYQAAEKNRALQEQTLDAEQKKYALGASTVFMVIQAQRDLANAESAKIAALAAYARARTQIEFATGQILATYNISMDEAATGKVSRPASPLPVLDRQGGGK